MDLHDEFRAHLASLALPGGRALVAVSGGLDSVVLLDLLHRTAGRSLELVVAHADHGIHPDSASVAERVTAFAAGLGLRCEVARLALGPGTGETSAREARYAWLFALRERLGAAIVFTAHHADDQAETVLMRALEGSGPGGLCRHAGGERCRWSARCSASAGPSWPGTRGSGGFRSGSIRPTAIRPTCAPGSAAICCPRSGSACPEVDTRLRRLGHPRGP